MPRAPQDELEVGRAERALAGLVDDRLARRRPELLDDFPAGLATHEKAPAWPLVADAGADPLRAPALVVGQVGEVGTVALAGVDDMVALGARGFEQRADRFDRRPGERQVITHRVDVAALAAEVGLHVDDDDGGVVRPPVAVPWPGIGIGGEGRHVRRSYLAIDSSPGMSRAECLALDVAIMMASVRM